MKVQVLFGAAFLSALLPACFAASFCSGQPLCCPRAGPGGRYLQLQQTNEQTLCTYGTDQNYVHCTYNTFNTDRLSSSNDCPSRLEQGSETSSYCPLRQEIRSGTNWDKCIQASDGDGSDVQLHDCSNANSQRLIFYSGALTQIQIAGTKFCLDVGSSPGPGTTVKIRTCSSWSDRDPKQLWRYDPTLFHILHIATNLYLNVVGSGEKLDLSPIASDVRQTWRTYK